MAKEVRSIKDLRAAYYARTHPINERCPKHPSVLMIQTTNPCTDVTFKFCPECGQEEINRQMEEMGAIAESQIRNFKSYAVFGRESIISPEIAQATISSFEIHTEQDENAVNFAKRFTREYVKERYEGNVIFQGPPGVGKSHLALGMAKTINEAFQKFGKRKSVVYMPVAELFSRMKEAFNIKDARWNEKTTLKFLTDVDFLVLDDLGKESNVGNTIKEGSSWAQSFLYQLLENRTKTIITTNYAGSQLKQLYEPSLLDRILAGSKDNKFIFRNDTESRRSIWQMF
ncbi:ATP-binding protein [Streptococcus anginosus]|uniref:ATP-binding protein n=1 Tax=Streptococcus anginosus TaxID=1328 RepID=UPI0021F85F06|nr:ATP-binding protein [Streptococcus anginosus]